MPNRISHISIRVLLAAALSLLSASVAAAVDLVEVRDGRHEKYHRIVFEFNGDVRYQLLEDVASGAVSIIFFEAASSVQPQLRGNPLCVDRLDLAQQGTDLVAGVVPTSVDVAVNHFVIKDPVRVVLDVYCRKEDRLLPAPSADENSRVPSVALAVPEPEEVGTPQKKNDLPPAGAPRTPVIDLQQPDGGEDAIFQKHMITILAALSILIIVLAGVIIFQSRSQTAKTLNDGSSVKLKASEDKLLSIDAEIREKLRSQGRPHQT